MIDDQNIHRCPGRFQLEAKLLLEGLVPTLAGLSKE